MGVVRLTSWSESKVRAYHIHPCVCDGRPPYIPTYTRTNQPQRERIYETTDLSQFRGKRLLIDAASFEFFLIEDVIGKQVRTGFDRAPLCSNQPNSINRSTYRTCTTWATTGPTSSPRRATSSWPTSTPTASALPGSTTAASTRPSSRRSSRGAFGFGNSDYNGRVVINDSSITTNRRAERAAPAVELNKKVFSHLRSPPRSVHLCAATHHTPIDSFHCTPSQIQNQKANGRARPRAGRRKGRRGRASWSCCGT